MCANRRRQSSSCGVAVARSRALEIISPAFAAGKTRTPLSGRARARRFTRRACRSINETGRGEQEQGRCQTTNPAHGMHSSFLLNLVAKKAVHTMLVFCLLVKELKKTPSGVLVFWPFVYYIILTSIETPDGRSMLVNASMTFASGFKISIMRL